MLSVSSQVDIEMKCLILILLILPFSTAIDTPSAWRIRGIFTRFALVNSLNDTDQFGHLSNCLGQFPRQDPNTGNFPPCQSVVNLFNCLNSSFYQFEYGDIISANMTLIYSKGYSNPCPRNIFPLNFTKDGKSTNSDTDIPSNDTHDTHSSVLVHILLHMINYIFTCVTVWWTIHWYHHRFHSNENRQSSLIEQRPSTQTLQTTGEFQEIPLETP